METDEWYNKASGFHSTCTCAKSEQVLREEIHQDSNNAHHCQCQTSDLNMLAMNPADKCLPIACTESVPGDRKADTSNVETILTHQLQSPSGVSKEADDQLLMGRWFALPSKNDDVDVMQGSVDMAVRHVLLRSHLDQTGLMNEPGSVNQRCEIFAFKGNSSVMTALTLNAAGFISDNRHCLDPHNGAFLNLMDVKPVLSTSATDMLHGNGQRGDIYIPSQGVVPPSISPSIPSVVSKPTNTGQGTNIPLSNLSPQCSQPQYYQQQQQQPQLVTTVMAPQFGVMEEAVFDQIQDAGGQILEEQTMRILNELQPGQFCSKEDFEYGQFIPSDPHSSTDLTPVIGVTFKTEANALSTSPVQVLPMNVNPFITSSSVTAASFKSADARGKRECGENVIKKDIPTNQSIGVSSNVTDSVYENQKVSIFTLNDPHVSMPLFGSDSEPNLSKDVSESQSFKPLSMTSNMAEVAVTSEEVNSNLVEESGECSSDDFEEIFMERNKRKRRSSHLTLLSPKRVRGQGSSKGVVNTKGASVRGLPAVKPDFMKGLAYHAKVAKAAHSQNVCMDKSDTDSDEEWTPDVERKKKSKGEEVLVGYGDEYARELSLIRDKNLLFRPKYVNGEEMYECVFCKTAFTTEVDCVGHLRRMHAGNKLASTDLQVLDQWLQENDNKSLKKYSKPVNHTTFNTMLNRISNVKHSKSDISQSVCDNQLTNAIIQKRNIENTDEMKYNVEVCAYSSDNSSQMKANMRKPTEKKIYKCEVCGKEFTQLGSLKIHMSIHTGEGLYTCEVCGYSCNQRVLLKKHMQKHTVERLFKCEVCVYACWRNVDLKKHMRIHTGERLYKSEVCGNACKSTNNLKKHTRIHTGDKLYKCEMCGYSCNLKGDLKKHMMIHTGERLYKCEVCGKAFTQSGNLKTHMRIHTGERLYKCEVCGKSFYTKGNFKTHMIIHTGEGQFTCEVCGYSCNQRVNLKTHIMIHTGETPYKCEVCGKSFRQSSALRRHMRIHTGERDYKCELCGYACSRGYTLKQHMRVHTGERLYKCELCGYACSRGSILKQHMQIHTGVTVDM